MSTPPTRRAALAALTGGATLASCRRGWTPPEHDPTARALVKPPVPGADAFATHEERWVHSSCGQCPAGCGIRVRVVEGRAVRIEGDRDNPLNQGGIGARGLSALQALYDADRITGPLRRRGDALVPVSWDDALDELGAALSELRAAGRTDQLHVVSGLERGVMHELLARFCRAFGTPSFVDGREHHTGTLARVMEETLGTYEIPVFGWEDARTVLSLEAGLLEGSCQAVYFTRVAAQRRRGHQGRARLIHAGPGFDLSAYNADQWLRVVPGTSGALALGLARAILARHAGDDGLREPLVAGAAAARELVAAFTPDRVAAETGVAPRLLERVAAELDEHRPSFVLVDETSLRYSNAADTAGAAMILNAVLGAFWVDAGGVHAAPPSPLPPWPEVAPDPIAAAGLGRSHRDGTLAALEADRPVIVLLHHANPAYARAQPERWRAVLSAVPLVVSFSPFRDETVEHVADLVLPDHTFLERWEIVTPAPALDRPILTRRAPAIVALHDTRSSGDVVLDLARRVGGAVAASLPWRTLREATEVRLAGLYDRGEHHDGYWLGERAAPATPRVTLHASYAPPSWTGDAALYPLGLLVDRPLGYAEGSGANQPWLRTLRPRPDAGPWAFVARVHPASAAGLRDGERVVIESAHGAITVPLRLDQRLVPGYVAVPMGAGHDAFGRWAVGFGANVLELLGQGARCATRVRVRRGAP